MTYTSSKAIALGFGANRRRECRTKKRAVVDQEASLRLPPGLPLQEIDGNDFVEVLRVRTLPCQLEWDNEFQNEFNLAILSCVESLYRDRIEPTLSELQKRLRDGGWGFREVQSILPMCARYDDTYKLLPPGQNSESLVLLRHSPEWFQGWVDECEPEDTFDQLVWDDFDATISGLHSKHREFVFSGTHCDLASVLHKQKMETFLHALSLGEMRNMVRLALGPKRRVLAYDALHGGRLTKPETSYTSKTFSPSSTRQPFDLSNVSWVTPEKTSARDRCNENVASQELQSVEGLMLAMLQNWPLPADLIANRKDQQANDFCSTLRKCLHNLYCELVKPTLREVQQRLLVLGWAFHEVQGVLPLCARNADFEVQIPTDGTEICILLRAPPKWFNGWNCKDSAGQHGASISPDVWDVLSSLLQIARPDLAGKMYYLAYDLRRRLFLAPLNELSLSVLCEIFLTP